MINSLIQTWYILIYIDVKNETCVADVPLPIENYRKEAYLLLNKLLLVAQHYHHKCQVVVHNTLRGSRLATFALFACPSNTNSLTSFPVPGAFWIPQHV